jgi:hypothetical protein
MSYPYIHSRFWGTKRFRKKFLIKDRNDKKVCGDVAREDYARLIVYAPEMLELLRELPFHLKEIHDTYPDCYEDDEIEDDEIEDDKICVCVHCRVLRLIDKVEPKEEGRE